MFAVIGRGLFYEVSPDRFGNLGKAFFTLFQLITLDDWFYMYSDVVKKDTGYAYIIIYLLIYIVLENFIFMNLFVAVLVDNFQRTLTAVEEKKGHKKSGIHIRSVFAGEEEVQQEDTGSLGSFSEESEEDEDLEEEIGWKPKQIEDFYPTDKFHDKKMRELLNQYYILLTSLEYNMQHGQRSQKTVNDLIDITVAIPDVPEELI
ncbi:Cation channel sperm-associated protein 1 [Exaiptasia diaphana]|nr:Cation channel sperm-associated protein 1 [Exaiptasia diaphana]